MTDTEKVIEYIQNREETELADFKAEFYSNLKNSDISKDIAAFANVISNEDRYLIFGVEDDTRNVIGIDSNSIADIDSINNYIDQTIEPFVNISLEQSEYKNKNIAFIKINSSNNNRPYLIKKECNNGRIQKGDIYIRKGTCNLKASRSDLDNIYENNDELIIRNFEQCIVIEPIKWGEENPAFGVTKIEIVNKSKKPYLINDGYIRIKSSKYSVCRSIPVILPNYMIQEKPLSIEPNSRKIYDALFDFTSQDCVDFDFDIDGNVDECVTVEIVLMDTDGNYYNSAPMKAMLIAKGSILHKVYLKKGKPKSGISKIFNLL